MEILSFFEWLDTSFLATISKAYGGTFAVIQMFHLLGLAVMGGMVLLSDLRLLGIVMRDVPSEIVVENTNRWFTIALIVLIATGIFMSSAVAQKLYYNEMFWGKMIGLLIGVLFVYFIKRPLLSQDHSTLKPSTIRSVAITSIIIWFSVAASGRWIGFS